MPSLRPRSSSKPTSVHSSCGPNPASASDVFTACKSVTSASISSEVCLFTSQVNPYESLVTSTGAAFGPMASSCRTSASMSWKARPSVGRKQTEPVPVGFSPIAACRVMAAVGSENNASRFGWTGLVRPSSVSRKPTGLLLAELRGDLGKLLQPPLQRKVRREDRGQARGVGFERGGEVERVQRLRLSQVLGG